MLSLKSVSESRHGMSCRPVESDLTMFGGLCCSAMTSVIPLGYGIGKGTSRDRCTIVSHETYAGDNLPIIRHGMMLRALNIL